MGEKWYVTERDDMWLRYLVVIESGYSMWYYIGRSDGMIIYREWLGWWYYVLASVGVRVSIMIKVVMIIIWRYYG